MKLELYYPVKPMNLNQGFGANPAYYARFLDAFGNPEKGHMGLDFMAIHGTPVYASIGGDAYFLRDEHGGEGIYIFSGPLDYANGTCWFNNIYWHLIGDTDPTYPRIIPLDGTRVKVKAGDLIGYADNTGAPFESSGDHLHFGLMPTDSNGNQLYPANGYGGCIDPTPYFNTYYAQDATLVSTIQKALISALSQLVDIYHQILGK